MNRPRLLSLATLGLAALAVLSSSACRRRDQPARLVSVNAAANHASVTNLAVRARSIETGRTDALGRTTRVACATCHALRPDGPMPVKVEDLKAFHVGMTFRHGTNSCSSCHGPRPAKELRLANGTLLPMTEVMQLCAQCHGPQFRDYQHGSHGGMTGYWDLRRGNRSRNNCVDCHDAHIPRIPATRPVLPPRDRFIETHEAGAEHT